MGTISVTASADAHATAETVWKIIADAEHWPDWSPNQRAALDQTGDPAPNGVGAIRRFGTGRVEVREEVVTFEPPRKFEYRLLSGLPMRDYLATVLVDDAGDHVRITWSATFRPKYFGTGWLFRATVQKLTTDYSAALAREAERVTARDA